MMGGIFFLVCNLMFMYLMSISLIMLIFSMYLYFFKIICFLELEIFMILGSKLMFPIYLDFMSSLFMSLVCFISSLIMIYSKIYMESDFYKIRFMYILNLFVMSMGLLIICPNLISLLLGWDGLGLVSYCLIIHYQNFNSDFSGMLTALTNRIGDSLLIISICLFFNMNSWNFLLILDWNKNFNLVLILLLASITKSAQVPFSSWLPAAMAAPTPVSSLVHSSTLVTAGIYLMIRFNKYLISFKFLSYLLLTLSLLTLCMAGISANLEMDFKKIIALSTLSQLGMMMSSLSIGLKEISFFHLVMHALFKAMMFMCSGNLIHLNFSSQDLRFYGKSMFISPLTFIMFNLSNLSLCGMFFLCGFYSKDLILELVLMSNLNLLLFILYMTGTGLTILYSYRLLNYSMKFYMNFYLNIFKGDNNLLMNMSIFPLFLFSTIMGFIFSNLYLFPMNYIILPLKLKLLITLICAFCIYLCCITKSIVEKIMLFKKFIILFEFMNSLMFLTFLSKKITSYNSLILSKYFFKTFSDGWIEYLYGLFFINYIFKNINMLHLLNFNKKTNNLMIFCLILLMVLMI